MPYSPPEVHVASMDSDPLAHWPDRTPLHDGDDLVAIFSVTESTRDGRPWADGLWRPATSPVVRTAAAVLESMPGWAVSTSDHELVDTLSDAGAAELRHAHTMTHALSGLQPLVAAPDLRIEPLPAEALEANAEAVAELTLVAYPPDHPDYFGADLEAAIREIHGIAHGEVLGAYLGQSQVAYVGNAIVGVCLLVERDGTAPDGGPWVIDIFRDPRAGGRGIGRSVLSAALADAAAAGLPSVSLVVSSANQVARGLYASLGFTEASESWTLALPHLT